MRDDCALTAEHITLSFPQMPGKLNSRKNNKSDRRQGADILEVRWKTWQPNW